MTIHSILIPLISLTHRTPPHIISLTKRKFLSINHSESAFMQRTILNNRVNMKTVILAVTLCLFSCCCSQEKKVDILIQKLRDKNQSVQLEAAEALGKIGTPAIKPLIAILKNEADQNVKWEASYALGKIGTPAVEPLIDLLKDGDPYVRRDTVYALGMIKDRRAITPLIDVLKDNQPIVRRETAKALGAFKDPLVIKSLIDILKDNESNVRWEAAGSLRNIGSPAIPPLIAALKDKKRDWNTRWEAASIMGMIGIPAIESLIDVIGDDDSYVKQGVAYALGKIKDPRAVMPLGILLKDKERNVRREAVMALGKIGTPAVDTLFDGLMDRDQNIRGTVIFHLISIGGTTKTIEKLIEVLNEKGDIEMANDFLNCGNQKLVEAAKSWVDSHNYVIQSLPGSHKGPRWESER